MRSRVKTTKQKSSFIISLVLLAWITVLTIDHFRAEHQKAPLFCVEIQADDDDSTVQYVGLLYQVYQIKNIVDGVEPMTIDYGYYVVPWFISKSYLKQMLNIT